jgi:hypothetical protein
MPRPSWLILSYFSECITFGPLVPERAKWIARSGSCVRIISFLWSLLKCSFLNQIPFAVMRMKSAAADSPTTRRGKVLGSFGFSAALLAAAKKLCCRYVFYAIVRTKQNAIAFVDESRVFFVHTGIKSFSASLAVPDANCLLGDAILSLLTNFFAEFMALG